MQLTFDALARPGLTVLFEGFVFALAVRRGLFRHFPIFTAYLLFVVASDVLRYSIDFTLGYRSMAEFVAYWGSQGVLTVLRGGVIYELCRHLLARYPGVWKLCWMILLLAGLVLLLFALVVNVHHGPYVAEIILTIDRGIELGILGVLVTALWFCHYYQIPVPRLPRLLGLGLSLYSAITVISNTVADRWFRQYQQAWAEARSDAFILAELFWLIAIWKPLPARQLSPHLLDFRVYSDMTSTVNVRLRELNAWLEEVLK